MNIESDFEALAISETRRRSPGSRKSDSVIKLLRDDKRFSTLVKHLEKSSDLSDDLDSKDITFFAPTNQAFEIYEKFWSESSGVSGGFEKERDMKEIIRYHICRDSEVCFDDMYEGQLLTSELKEKSLDNDYQMIRISKCMGTVLLNHYVHVVEADLKTGNGIVHVVDNVLCPPKHLVEQIFMLPFVFSTFTSAVQCVGLKDKLMNDKAITCLIPNNAAWKQMHMLDLIYLFSAAGAKDLKKVIEYHMCKDLVYACDIMEDEEVKMETYCKGEKLRIKAIERRKESSDRTAHHHNPQKWILSVNCGESTIKCTDFLARNGNVQMISTVLIPDCVCLPSIKGSKEREGSERRRNRDRDGRRRRDDEDSDDERRRNRDRDGRRRRDDEDSDDERRRRRRGDRDGRRRSFQ